VPPLPPRTSRPQPPLWTRTRPHPRPRLGHGRLQTALTRKKSIMGWGTPDRVLILLCDRARCRFFKTKMRSRAGRPRKTQPANAMDSQRNGARLGSSCFWPCFQFSLGDLTTAASSPPPVAVVACRWFTRIAHLKPFSLSRRNGNESVRVR
jgi:hypothetical protein